MNFKNAAYGTALYLAAIFALYGSKATTYRDEDSLKAAIRQGQGGK